MTNVSQYTSMDELAASENELRLFIESYRQNLNRLAELNRQLDRLKCDLGVSIESQTC